MLAVFATTPVTASAQSESSTAAAHRLSLMRGAGAESCPDGNALGRDVEHRLGRAVFSPSAARSIEAMVARRDDAYHAELFVRDENGAEIGHRVLVDRDASCGSIAAAMSLAVALVIDPDAVFTRTAPESARVETPAPVASEPRTAPADSRSPTSARSESTVATTAQPARVLASGETASLLADPATPAPTLDRVAQARIGATVGIAIDLVPGVGVVFATYGDAPLLGDLRWRIGMFFAPQTQTGGSGRFGFTLTAGTADACYGIVKERVFGVTLCAGIAAGAIGAVVFDPVPNLPGERFWIAARAELSARLEVLPGFGIGLSVSPMFPFERLAFFVIGRAVPEFQQPVAIPSAAISLDVSL